MPVLQNKPVFDQPTDILALDYGDVRIGVARASTFARLPQAIAIIKNDAQLFDNLSRIITEQQATLVIVGVPRNLSGEFTPQSEICKNFAEELSQKCTIDVYLQDETLTSVQADTSYMKGTSDKYRDDIAACLILKDFLEAN